MNKQLNYLFALSLLTILISCGKKDDKSVIVANQKPNEAGKTGRSDQTDTSSILGYYVGDFVGVGVNYDKDRDYQDNRITISIDSLGGEEVYGHSIVAGNKVSFIGKYKSGNKTYRTEKYVVTNAIGYKEVYGKKEHVHIGHLNFIMDSRSGTLQGTWDYINKKAAPYNFETYTSMWDSDLLQRHYNGELKREGGWNDAHEHYMYLGQFGYSGDKMTGKMEFEDYYLSFEGDAKKISIDVTVKEYEVVDAKEQGDSDYNGVFTFTVDPSTKILSGKWTPNDSNAVSLRYCTFNLRKSYFEYNPKRSVEMLRYEWLLNEDDPNTEDNEYETLTEAAYKFNASTTLLKEEDISNMYMADLEVMRNAIYARHGYSFPNRRMRYLFDKISWYVPVSIDVRDDLTEIELANIQLLKRYEEHAEKYYDYFGR